MKKRIFSLFLVLCFMLTCSAAWAKLPNNICILESDTEGEAADEYEYTAVVNGTTELPDDFNGITLGYGNSSGNLAACYISIGASAIANNQSLQTADYSLGNGLTVSVTQTDANHAVLKITGTPNKVGSVSFVVTRSSQTGTVKNMSSATLTVKVTNAPSTSAPTISNPTMPQVVHGRAFSATITATDNYDVDEGEYVDISIVDPNDIEDDDESVVYLSSEELSETYGITAEMSGDSTLVLAADKVASPTPIDKTVKFRVSTYNDYTNTDEYAADHDGSKVVTRDFTLKFTAIAPKIASVHIADPDATKYTKTDLGTYPITIAEEESETEGYSIKAKNKKIKKNGDDEEETPAVRVYFKTNKTTAIPEAETQGDNEDGDEEETEQILKVSDLPDGLTFTLYKENLSDDLTVKISEFVYVLEGNPTKAGTFNITVTPSNSVYNVKDNAIRYSLTVVDAPSIKSPTLDKGLTAITFGSKYNGTSISLNGGNRDHSPSISKVEVLTDSDLKELPSFLSVDKSNKFIVSSTNSTFDSLAQVKALKTALGVEDEVVDGFGDKGEVTLNLQFTFSCDVFAENVIPVESRSVVIKTIKPAFDKDKKNQTTANKAISDANLKAGEAIDKIIELEASAPGNIIWSYDKLPDGIKLSAGTDDADTETKSITPDKSGGLKSAVTITGTPTTPAKNYSTTIRAHNGAGYTDVKLTFNIAAPTPEIAYKVKGDNGYSEYDGDWTPFSGDKKVGEEVDIIVYNKAPNSGATKFTAKLPGGLTLKKVDGADSDRQARITGKYNKAATNATIEITAEDQDSAAKPKVTAKLTGVNIYAMPKISTSKLNDLTVGKFDIVTVAGDGVSKWYVSASTVNQKPDTEITTETPIGIGGIYSADIETNDRTGVSTLKLGRTLSTIPSETEQTIRIWAENFADVVSKDLKFKVKGEKVKITTTKLNDCYPTEAGETKIEFTGSPAIDSIAYISENDAKSAGLNDGEIIMLTGTEATDYKISYANGKIKKGENTPLHKGIKITVSADNGLGEAKKVYTLVIKGMDPKWLYGTGDDQENVTGKTMGTGKGTKDYEKNLITYDVSTAKSEFLTLTVSGDKPFEITNTTLPKGITADVTSSDSTNPTVTISYAVNPDAKPGNNKVTFTAKNTATGKSAKVTVVLTALQAPNISNKEALETGKEVEGGKKLSLKATLNPADKSATWAIIRADLPLNHSIITDAAQIKDKFGIEIDQKGVIGGTTKGVTSTDSGADFMKLLIKVSNDAGEDYAYANIKIKGSKPKIDSKTKQFTFVRGENVTTTIVSEDYRMVKAQGIDSLDIVMTEEGSGLSDLGLSISPRGVITGTPTAGTKGTNVTIKANHFGAEANLKVKIIVNDPEATLAPDGVTPPITFNATLTDKGKVEEKDEQEITVKLSSAATQVPQWKIAAKPNYSGVTVKITEKNEESATILITLKKNAAGKKSGDIYPTIHTSFKISATNKSNKKTSTTAPISVDISFGQDSTTEAEEAVNENSDVKEADKKENELVEEELTKELGEGDLSIGAERTESALTDEQKAAIKAEGYMIAAILPEISATTDGQYGLEVDLLADVPAGSELKWLAYPQSPAEPSTDDEIADFFDIDGADTTTVPSDHIVLVYPWLREGVKYAPVIVAKVSEAAPGDVVSEEGIDEAVENAKEGKESTEEIVLDEEGKTTEAPAENAEENQETTNTETPAEKAANDESKPEETSTEAQSE